MKRPADMRWRTLVVTLAGILLAGILVKQFSGRQVDPANPENSSQQQAIAKARNREVDRHFQQAVVMLHTRKYEFAIAALQKTLELAPLMPEAYVNMGYALLGLERYDAARQYFATAIDLRPGQANAYWGLAVSLEPGCDYDAAIGAMRTFIHLSDSSGPYLKKAQAAIWEWDEARKNSAQKDKDGTISVECSVFSRKKTTPAEKKNSAVF